MVKTCALLLALGLLAGCAGAQQAKREEAQATEPESHCYQADWQAETAPVINKRAGTQALDKYDTPAKERGCP